MSAVFLQVPIGGGLNEASDEAFIQPPNAIVAQNVVFPDAQSCVKRPGLKLLATVPGARGLVARGAEVLVVDGVNAYGYVPTAGTMVARGRVSPCMASRALLGGGTPAAIVAPPLATSVFQAGSEAPFVSVAEGAGYRVSVQTDNTAYTATVFDVAGDVQARPLDILNATAGDGLQRPYSQPRVMVIGTTAVALYYKISTGALIGRTLDLTNVAAGWATELTLVFATANAPIVWDASPVTAGTTFAMVIGNQATGLAYFYLCNTSFGTVSAHPFDAAIGLGRTQIRMTAAAIRATGDDNVVACSWAYTYQASGDDWAEMTVGTFDATSGVTITPPWQVVNTSITGKPAPTVKAIGIERIYGQGGSNPLYMLTWTFFDHYETPGAGTANGVVVNQDVLTTVWGTFAADDNAFTRKWTGMAGVQMVSKPFARALQDGLHLYMLGLFSGLAGPGVQALYELPWSGDVATFAPMLPMATVAPRFSGADATGAYLIPRNGDVTNIGATGAQIYTTGATIQTEPLALSASLISFDFASPGMYQSVQLGDFTFVAGGLPQLYDGRRLTEVGFLHAPLQPALSNASGAGPSFGNVPTTSAMSYVVCYSQLDDNGNVHRSPPSPPLTFATQSAVAHQGNELVIFTCRATHRQELPATQGGTSARPIAIELYRNTVAQGSVYQLVGIFDNDVTVNTIGLTDGVADAAFATNPVLYSQGSVPSDGPPSLACLAVHANRIFGTSEDGKTQYFTTPLTTGEAPRFTDAFTIAWPDGPATGAWSLEGRLHQATDSSIMFVLGDGPADTGAGSDFTQPQVWQRSLGVVDPRGVVLTNEGAVLNTNQGLYLETRSSELQWIGQAVQRSATGAVQCMAALNGDGSVRISLDQGGSVGGMVVHWDGRRGRWATHITTAFAVGGASQGVASSFAVANGVLHSLYGGQYLVREDAATSLDNGAWVTLAVRTAWAKPADVQGWSRLQRIGFLGASLSPHGIGIGVTLDYSSTSAGAGVWTDGQIAATPLEQLRFMPATQKGESFSVSIVDIPPSGGGLGTGRGPQLRALSFSGTAKTGGYKNLAASKDR